MTEEKTLLLAEAARAITHRHFATAIDLIIRANDDLHLLAQLAIARELSNLTDLLTQYRPKL